MFFCLLCFTPCLLIYPPCYHHESPPVNPSRPGHLPVDAFHTLVYRAHESMEATPTAEPDRTEPERNERRDIRGKRSSKQANARCRRSVLGIDSKGAFKPTPLGRGRNTPPLAMRTVCTAACSCGAALDKKVNSLVRHACFRGQKGAREKHATFGDAHGVHRGVFMRCSIR